MSEEYQFAAKVLYCVEQVPGVRGYILGAFIDGAGYFTRVSGTLDFCSVERNPQTYAIRREKDAIPPYS